MNNSDLPVTSQNFLSALGVRRRGRGPRGSLIDLQVLVLAPQHSASTTQKAIFLRYATVCPFYFYSPKDDAIYELELYGTVRFEFITPSAPVCRRGATLCEKRGKRNKGTQFKELVENS